MNNLLNEIFLIISLITKNIFYKTKKLNQEYILVSAVDDDHFIYLENLIENFRKKRGKFNKFIVYGLNLSPEYQIKLHSLDFVDFREFKFKNYPSHFSLRIKEHNNKIGGFAWKPAIILELFKEQKYQKVIWLDSACLFDNRISLFKLLINNKGFASFYSTGNIKDWTHKSVLKSNGIEGADKILNSRNLMGGVLGFNFKNNKAVKLLESWYELCLESKNIFPDGGNISNHRHDQSLISICYWQNFRETLPVNTKLFGIKIQNWPNKILYFYDEFKNYREELLKKYLFYSTTTNSRCKIIILFKPESLKYIPFRLLLTKKILMFVPPGTQIEKLNQFNLKKYFILTYTAKNTSFKKAKKINFILPEIDNIIREEYMKEISA